MNNNRCVVCGAIIPEGMQVCMDHDIYALGASGPVFIDYGKFTEMLIKAVKNDGRVIIDAKGYRLIEIRIDPTHARSEINRVIFGIKTTNTKKE